jgi:hypothetical protein
LNVEIKKTETEDWMAQLSDSESADLYIMGWKVAASMGIDPHSANNQKMLNQMFSLLAKDYIRSAGNNDRAEMESDCRVILKLIMNDDI